MVRIGGGIPPAGGIISESAQAWRLLPTGQKNVFWMFPSGSAPYLTMTGSAVETTIKFRVPVTILAIMLQHTDNVNALSSDMMTWYFSTPIGMNPFFAQHFEFIKYTNTTVSNLLETFEDFPRGLPLPAGDYILSANTTNTDRLFPRFLIEIEEEED